MPPDQAAIVYSADTTCGAVYYFSSNASCYYREPEPTLPPPWRYQESPADLRFHYHDCLHSPGRTPPTLRFHLNLPCWKAGRWKSLT